MSAPHVLVITARYPDDPESTELDYDIECPGVTDKCRAWLECRADDCPSKSDDDDVFYDDELVGHGVAHQYIDGLGWCVPTNHCYPRSADELCEVVHAWVGVGRYKIEDFHYDGGGLDGLDLGERAP